MHKAQSSPVRRAPALERGKMDPTNFNHDDAATALPHALAGSAQNERLQFPHVRHTACKGGVRNEQEPCGGGGRGGLEVRRGAACRAPSAGHPWRFVPLSEECYGLTRENMRTCIW